MGKRRRVLFAFIVLTLAMASNRPPWLHAQLPGGLNTSLAALPSPATAGQTVTFTYRASPPAVAPPFPNISSLTIDFGDGQTESERTGASGETVSSSTTHVYTVAGTYTATLSAAASNGGFGASNSSVIVIGGGQSSSLTVTASPGSAVVGQQVQFTYSASTSFGGPTVRATTINFGDGATMPLNFPAGTVTHAYSVPGSYQVVLAATSGSGQPSQATAQVQIGPVGQSGPVSVIQFQPGWDLISIPAGLTVPSPLGLLYTLQPGDSAYQTVQNTQPGLGYWVFVSSPVIATVSPSGPQTAARSLPAGQYVMIGNPGTTPATVAGADIVYSYNGAFGYQPTTILQPGQGAWAYSNFGGTVTIVGQPG